MEEQKQFDNESYKGNLTNKLSNLNSTFIINQ